MLKIDRQKNAEINYLIGTFFKLSAVTFPEDDVVRRRFPAQLASPLLLTMRSACNFSQTFFLGLRTSSGSPDSYPSITIFSPGRLPGGGLKGSTAFVGSSLIKTKFINIVLLIEMQQKTGNFFLSV